MKQVKTLNCHLGRILSLELSPDGGKIASAGGDEMLCLWDVGDRGKVCSAVDLLIFSGNTFCILYLRRNEWQFRNKYTFKVLSFTFIVM